MRPSENQVRTNTAAAEETRRELKIQAMCDFLDRKLNAHSSRVQFLDLAQMTDTLPTEKFVGNQEDNNDRLRRMRFRKNELNHEKFNTRFEFEVPALGTFETIKPDGTLPDDPDLKLNPITQNLADHLREHDVKVDIEIPLPKLKLSQPSTLKKCQQNLVCLNRRRGVFAAELGLTCRAVLFLLS